MNNVHTNATQTILQRILELYSSGLTPHEITTKILTSEPETAKFRAELLIEIIMALLPTGMVRTRKNEKGKGVAHINEGNSSLYTGEK